MNRFFPLLLCATGPFWAEAQVPGDWAPCATDALHAARLASEPGFDRSFARFEAALRTGQATGNRMTEGVLILPTVVHVLHTGEAEGTGANLSVAQIESAIAAVNADLRGITGGIDTEIELALARRTPAGLPTDGIVRIDASAVDGYAAHGIASAGPVGASEWSVKALSVWPASEYINIWVVHAINGTESGGGTLGFAYLPPAPPSVDGIVVRADAFGTVGALSPFSLLNRTLTHELGHSLGLHHTFHATAACGAESDCSLEGDRVCDTPETLMNPGCTVPAACPGALQDNYMDYVAETCMQAFTPGQKERMRSTLETARPSLLASTGALPLFANDCAATGLVFPSGSCVSGDEPGVAKVRNVGTEALAVISVAVSLNGAAPWTIDLGTLVAPGATLEVPLPPFAWNAGENTLVLTVQGESDAHEENNTFLLERTVLPGEPVTVTVVPDVFGYETTWHIVDADGALWMQGGPYANGTTGTPVATTGCVPAGCHTFALFDSYGDGMAMGDGSFSGTGAEGTTLFSGGGNFGASWETVFCVSTAPGFPCADANANGICDGIETAGCMLPEACNYSPEATLADACTFAAPGFDCAGNPVAEVQQLRPAVPRTVRVHPNPAAVPKWEVSGLPPRSAWRATLRSLDGATAARPLDLMTDAVGRTVVDLESSIAAGVYLLELNGSVRLVLRVAVQ